MKPDCSRTHPEPLDEVLIGIYGVTNETLSVYAVN